MRRMLVPAIAVLLLSAGVLLVVRGRKSRPRWPFFLAGGSLAGFVLGALLHNVVSATFKTEEAFFFILAVFACPVLFLAGTGAILYFRIRGR